MQQNKVAHRCLAGVLIAVVLAAAFLLPANVASAERPDAVCVRHKRLQNWNNLPQLVAHGFNSEVFGESAALTFSRDSQDSILSLDIAATGLPTTEYAASRITEIDATLPVGERVKCWQPTDTRRVVAEFEVRFDQPVTPGLTENLMFWNAPLGQDPIPITTIGVSRSFSTGGVYAAVVAQDLVLAPEFSGFVQVSPMPEWLDDTAWHRVRVTIATDSALIEIAQGEHAYTTVLQTALPHRPEPLGFQFSIDNEVLPGLYSPVPLGDGIDVRYFDVQLRP